MDDRVIQNGILFSIAQAIGAPEQAIRILVSILLGYPIALFNCFYLRHKSPIVQHLFFTITGICIGFFNFGWDIGHSFGCILVQYLLIKILSGTRICVGLSFIFHMSYLLLEYYQTGTDTYDIKWSMPHCVLTLRLIGLCLDYYDGRKKPDQLNAHQKKMALVQAPSLLEMCGHVYFPGGFLVGPQFSMKRYLDFTNSVYEKESGDITQCIRPGLVRAGLGFFYLALYQVASNFISDAVITSESFYEHTFIIRVVLLGLWAKISLYKYISCWLLTEGVCTMSGLTYNGKDEKGRHLWNGCANVKLRVFENATRFGHLIQSFNLNTNAWVAEYIYKRLRFLGNRSLSQAIALFFLAAWHGLHMGYYVCFFMELIVMLFEKDMELLAAKNSAIHKVFNNPTLTPVRWVIGKIYVFWFMGYCLAPFTFFSDYWSIYGSLYYMGFVVFLGWRFIAPFLLPRLLPRSPRLNSEAHSEEKVLDESDHPKKKQ